MHGHARLRQRAGHQVVAHAIPDLVLRRGPADAEFALHAPLRKQRQFAAQQLVVEGWQRRARHALLPLQQGLKGVAHQRVGTPGVAQGVEVELVAQVGQQQEALVLVRGQHRRRVQAGGLDQPATCTKGRTSSSGGGASITMKLVPAACTRR